jgi:hypothetical protein
MQQLSPILEKIAEHSAIDAERLDQLRDDAQQLDASNSNEGDVTRRAAWFDQLRLAMDESALSDDVIDALADIADEPAEVRQAIARLLASSDSPQALDAFVTMILSGAIDRPHDILIAFSPLFQRQTYDPAAIFPRLLDGLENPLLAAVVLDLANHLVRRGRLKRHPAADRTAALATLLGAIVQRLQSIEERPASFASSPKELSTLVGDSITLVVALCDALALIGDDSIVGKLHQALELSHRRVRTEAAAALARLGDDRGPTALAELAASPAMRQRALAYLDELGLTDRAAEEHRSPKARAEGELAAWLAMPTHFGAPPTDITLIDHRRMHWPGYESPIDCWLFDFEYRTSQGSFSSVAIVGPVTHAMPVDLEDYSPDDIYALYAGWSAEHDEITEQPAEELSEEALAAWERIAAELSSTGYQDLFLVKVGRFFGATDWVATAKRQAHEGVIVASEDRAVWYPRRTTHRAPGPREVYWIDKGRRLLATFNRASKTGNMPSDSGSDVDENLGGE